MSPSAWLATIGLLSLPASALASVRQVPQAFATITAALAAAAPGDTVLVAAGTYSPASNGESFPLQMATDGVRLLGAGADLTVLDAMGSAGVIRHTATVGGRVSGFRITGGVANEGGGVNIVTGDLELDHDRIEHNGAAVGGGAISARNAAAPWIHHNVILDSYATTPADVHALRLNTNVGGVFEHNLVAHSDGNGLLTVDDVTTLVRDNIFFQNGIPSPARGRGICWLSGMPPRIHHNLFFQNQVAALLWVSGGGDLSGSAANDFDANDEVYANLDLDPRFVDAGAGDYHLQASSPAIDAGDPLAPHDADGTVADIGPFPYLPVASVPPARGQGVRLAVAPNPARDGADVRFSLAAPGRARAEVLDAAGRIVRTLADGERPGGDHLVRWDGRDDSGSAIPPGLYFVRLRTGTSTQACPVVVIR